MRYSVVVAKIRRTDLIYPELSYAVIGCAFDVYNTLGAGHMEKYYQAALSKAFDNAKISYREQVYFPLKYHNETIGKHFFDFLIEEKIVLELKRGDGYARKHIEQVASYLRVSNLQLALLINFGETGVKYKRIVNKILE